MSRLDTDRQRRDKIKDLEYLLYSAEKHYKDINDKLAKSEDRLNAEEEKNYVLMEKSCNQERYVKSLKRKLNRLKKQ